MLILLLIMLILPLKTSGATVILEGDLTGDPTGSRGIVKITLGTRSGYISDEGWNERSALVICRMLGFSGKAIAVQFADKIFNSRYLEHLVENVNCDGQETDIEQCEYQIATSTSNKDAGVICLRSESNIALSLTPYHNSAVPHGALLVNVSGVLGRIIDIGWTDKDATVACRSMGLIYVNAVAIRMIKKSYDRQSTFILGGTSCTGDEASLNDCGNQFGSVLRLGNEDGFTRNTYPYFAGIICSENDDDFSVRLSDGFTDKSGRADFQWRGLHGTINTRYTAGYSHGARERNVSRTICNMAGFNDDNVLSLPSDYIGKKAISHDKTLRLAVTECKVPAETLKDCLPNTPLTLFYEASYFNKYDIYIFCVDNSPENTTRLQLVGGESAQEGRVELIVDGILCQFSSSHIPDKAAFAANVCRQLGIKMGAIFEQREKSTTTSTMWGVRQTSCLGSEQSIWVCNGVETQMYFASTTYAFGVKCGIDPVAKISISNGIYGYVRLDPLSVGSMRYICDKEWDQRKAHVACSQAGFRGFSIAIRNPFGKASGYNMGEAHCSGDEMSLWKCMNGTYPLGVGKCPDDGGYARIMCGLSLQNVTVMPLGPASPLYGAVMVDLRGVRTKLCNSTFDDVDASVICSTLGFSSESALAELTGRLGVGSGSLTWIENIHCKGHETHIYDCLTDDKFGWTVYGNCSKNQGVAVICQPNKTGVSVTLQSGPHKYEGRVELTVHGKTGGICRDGWDNKDAKVICSMMGHRESRSYVTERQYGSSSYIWTSNSNCTGDEDSITECVDPGYMWGAANCPSGRYATVGCVPAQLNMTVTLQSSANEDIGVVKIRNDATLGNVCDDDWDENDAAVACRMVGRGGKVVGVRGSYGVLSIYFNNRISWMTNVTCNGYEKNLWECNSQSKWPYPACTKEKAAGVLCNINQQDIVVSVTEGKSPMYGRVYVTLKGLSSTVCNNALRASDVPVLCQMAGYSAKGSIMTNTVHSNSKSTIISTFGCKGNETNIYQCGKENLGWTIGKCTSDIDAWVSCFPKQTGIVISLVGGPHRFEGRLDLTIYGISGSICADGFDEKDAAVACNMLGYSKVGAKVRKYGTGGSTKWLNQVNCTGHETSIVSCVTDSHKWGDSSCSSGKFAGVSCLPLPDDVKTLTVVFKPKSTNSIGTLALVINGTHGRICDSNWDERDAAVACRMRNITGPRNLAIRNARNMVGSSIPTDAPSFLSKTKCIGTEVSLWDCRPEDAWPSTQCSPLQEAGVACNLQNKDIAVSLTGGLNSVYGKVIVNLRGKQGTICDTDWDNQDASVICKMLGFRTGYELKRSNAGTGLTYIDRLCCQGSESHILDCLRDRIGWIAGTCSSGKPAWVSCQVDKSEISLWAVNGPNEAIGRVEITVRGVYGKVCDNTWDERDAAVVCRTLDYHGKVIALRNAIQFGLGYGTGNTLIEETSCVGSEQHILDCLNKGLEWPEKQCPNTKNAGIVCGLKNEVITVSLAGGRSSTEGRVYISIYGKRGTICDKAWDDKDAAVICSMLGFGTENAQALPSSVFGSGAGVVWFETLACRGNERHILDCITDPYGWTVYGTCTHADDAGIRCRSSVDLTDAPDINIPLVKSIYPPYGPQSGGTIVTISGEHMEGVSIVQIARKDMDIVTRNESVIVIKTLASDVLWEPLPFTIIYFGGDLMKTAFEFTYKPDPEVTRIYPLQIIKGGGVNVTVYGHNLDSVSEPTIVISITIDATLHQYISICHITNSSQMVCETPKIDLNVTEDEQDKFQIGFGMDGVTKWKNVTQHIPDYGTFTIKEDPKIHHIEGPMVASELDVIEIKGDNVANVPEDQYLIHIGVDFCHIVDLKENALLCRPPRSAPPMSVDDRHLREHERLILVDAGHLLTFDVGILNYANPLNVPLVGGVTAAAVVVVIICIVTVVLYKKKRNEENRSSPQDTQEQTTSDRPHDSIGSFLQNVWNYEQAQGEQLVTPNQNDAAREKPMELVDGYLTPLPVVKGAETASVHKMNNSRSQSCVGRIGENFSSANRTLDGAAMEGNNDITLRTSTSSVVRSKYLRDTYYPPENNSK